MAEAEGPKAPPAAPGASRDRVQESPLRAVVGLFVVPLLVVLLCVAVFIGFGWIAYEHQTTADYLNDLRSWWKPRRAQAAYELSKILVADPRALEEEPGAEAEVRRLFQETGDPEMKRYLALVLGRTRDPEATPLLLECLDDPDSQIRIYCLWALGTMGDLAARESLESALTDSDRGIRKTAAFALGELGEPSAAGALEALLADPAVDVRWNAALALARLGSDAGVPVLRRMLDRGLTAQVPEITPEQQEEAMLSAVRALAAVGGAGTLELLERLAEEDPSRKVRQAAIEARKAIARSGE